MLKIFSLRVDGARAYLRRQGAHDLSLVLLDHVESVDVEHLVGVHSHQDAPGVRLQREHASVILGRTSVTAGDDRF